ncbi:hypothetical protein EDC96DRAFT_532709 [Choanephora cucurbitarum]|nr:hypothetical protein EDC96DRAFT_532709 [Choanephora cucurbitarum]
MLKCYVQVLLNKWPFFCIVCILGTSVGNISTDSVATITAHRIKKATNKIRLSTSTHRVIIITVTGNRLDSGINIDEGTSRGSNRCSIVRMSRCASG